MTTTTVDIDRLLTETETAEVLGVRPGTMRHWRTTGRVGQPPYVRLGRQIRFRSSDLAAYVAGLPAGEDL